MAADRRASSRPAYAAPARLRARQRLRVLRRLLQRPELASLGGLVAAFAVFSILRPDLFLSQDNGVNVASLAAQYGIVAVGVTVLMIAGHFDLSVGTIVGLTGLGDVLFRQRARPAAGRDHPVHARFGAAARRRSTASFRCARGLPSFIITLATSLVYRGVLTMNTSGFPVVVKFPASYAQVIAGKHLFGYRMSLLWFLVVAALATLFLLRTRMGNWTFAIGQNPPRPGISACPSLARQSRYSPCRASPRASPGSSWPSNISRSTPTEASAGSSSPSR